MCFHHCTAHISIQSDFSGKSLNLQEARLIMTAIYFCSVNVRRLQSLLTCWVYNFFKGQSITQPISPYNIITFAQKFNVLSPHSKTVKVLFTDVTEASLIRKTPAALYFLSVKSISKLQCSTYQDTYSCILCFADADLDLALNSKNYRNVSFGDLGVLDASEKKFNILCYVCNGKADCSLNFDILWLKKATNQFQTSDKASHHVSSVAGITDARTESPRSAGLNLSPTKFLIKILKI